MWTPGELRTGVPQDPPWIVRSATWASRVVALAALWCVIAIAVQPLWPRVDRLGELVFGLVNVPVAPNLFTAAMLATVAVALLARKRAALIFATLVFQVGWLVVAALVLILRTTTVRGPVREVLDSRLDAVAFSFEVVFALVAISVAYRARHQFSARLAPGSWRRFLGCLVVGLALSAAVGVVLTEVFPHTLRGQRRIAVWPVRTAVGLMPAADSPYYNGAGHGWVATVIGVCSTLTLAYAGTVFFRSARLAMHLEPSDELQVRSLLLRYGEADSLGYFATRRDKTVVFSADREAAVLYRVEAGTMLASGDPVGEPRRQAEAVRAFLEQARIHGWVPAVLGASERGAELYRAAGLRVYGIGDEAVLDVASFSLATHERRNVRQAVTRARRGGYHVEVRRHGEVGAAELAEVARCAELWRGDASERGFSMALGRLGDPSDRRCVLVTARDEDGALRGLLSLVPWGRGGLSLDLMRRDPGAVNGTIELMVSELVAAANALGVRRISLNFAMFREVFSDSERIGSGPIVRMLASVLVAASRWWQIETLYRSNVKYRPEWRPRYLCVADAFTLNHALLASGIAEGFLPRLRREAHSTQAPATPALVDAVLALEREVDDGAEPPVVSPMMRGRHRKLARLEAAGTPAYPVQVARTASVAEVRARHGDLDPDRRTGERVTISGRVIALRRHGRLDFARLREATGELQVLVRIDGVDPSSFASWSRTVDRGDHVSCSGELITTRTGELTIDVSSWQLAAKCLRPFPRWTGRPLAPEVRNRNRTLALLVDPTETERLLARGRALRALRRTLDDAGFLEVETPMLHAVQGGATARPFRTYSNAYDVPLYLRIAPELYLKRLATGGIERLYELNRNFRNEGADATHNPEFTALEVYHAYADYETMRLLAQRLIVACADAVLGTTELTRTLPDGTVCKIALDAPWPVVLVHDAVSAACGLSVDASTSVEELRRACAGAAVRAPFDATAGELVQALYEALVEPTTIEPTFFTDFPVDVSPLARAHREDARVAERWDLVIFGMELGTAYSELNDPLEQRERLVRQARRGVAGDLEAMAIDEDFLSALELALPPTGGLGLGVDRLLMLCTGGGIRESLAFPFVRPLHPPVGQVDPDTRASRRP